MPPDPAPIRAVAVDDEPAALRGLIGFLEERDDFHLVGSARSGQAMIDLLAETDAEVAFVDVRLGDMTAFEALDRVEKTLPHIVFVSAYEEYAVRAFEKHAIDFLLKPFGARRFAETCERLRDRLDRDARPREGQRIRELLAELVDLLGPGALEAIHRPRGEGDTGASGVAGAPVAPAGGATRFAARSGDRVVLVRASEVVWARAARDYVRLHTRSDAFLVRETMAGLENRLTPEGFVRVHRSTIVRTSAISEVKRSSTGRIEVVLDDGTRHPVSRSGHRKLEATLGLTI